MNTTAGHIEVVPAGTDDASIVHTMVRELAAHEGSLGSVSTTVERWGELLVHPDVVVLIARADGDAVGYVSAVRALHLWSGVDVVLLDDLYVRAPWRGRGVGPLLMRAVADRHAGLAVGWEVDEGDLAGQRFFLHLGARLRRKVIAWWQPSVDDQPMPSR